MGNKRLLAEHLTTNDVNWQHCDYVYKEHPIEDFRSRNGLTCERPHRQIVPQIIIIKI